MGSKKQPSDIRQPILMVYVAVCVIAIVLTVLIAFEESGKSSQLGQPTATRTLSPLVLTDQAERAQAVATEKSFTVTPNH